MELVFYLQWGLVALALAIFLLWPSSTTVKLPPGPRALPLIGHLHLLGSLPHQSLQELSKRYGPLMTIKLGAVTTIVASDAETAKLVLQKYDSVFCSRPVTAIIQRSVIVRNDLAFAPYGEKVRALRRLCATELFNTRRVKSFAPIIMDELQNLQQALLLQSGREFEVKKCLLMMAFNVVTRILMRKTYFHWDSDEKEEDREFFETVDELARVIINPSFDELFPMFAWLGYPQVRRLEKTLSKHVSLIDKILNEHERQDHDEPDFVDTMEDFFGSKDNVHIKSMISDLLFAGIETSSTTVEWALAELVRSPSTMIKLQTEIGALVGVNSRVEEDDIPKLTYLDWVIKESLRLHPPAGLMVPHAPLGDQKLCGYDIPENSTLLINIYAIMRDPAIWSNPNVFDPDRFASLDVDLYGHHFELIPFGSGRRICPGLPLGLKNVQLTLANLVHSFDWSMEDGQGTKPFLENTGLVTSLSPPLKVQLTPRA